MSDERPRRVTGRYVKLNVGGTLFFTTTAILTKHDSLLKTMLIDGPTDQDNEGCTVVDRCGKHFGTILDYLKTGNLILPESRTEITELLVEAKYYRLDELIKRCEKALVKDEPHTELICRIPLVTSDRETRFLTNTTNLPVIKLLINRHNNKYSYTHMSDDNLLKNIELFDKLSVKHGRRILFIKDIDDISEQICSWSFIRNGVFCATVCCTCNVCETDKMYTRVDFPEAKIREEIQSILRSAPTVP